MKSTVFLLKIACPDGRRFFHIAHKNKKSRGSVPGFFVLGFLLGHFGSALCADALVLVERKTVDAAAKNTARFILSENDIVLIHIDFQRVAFRYVQGLAQLDGQNNSSQIIDLPNHTR
jgi:hypothetical protein